MLKNRLHAEGENKENRQIFLIYTHLNRYIIPENLVKNLNSTANILNITTRYRNCIFINRQVNHTRLCNMSYKNRWAVNIIGPTNIY